MGVFRTEKMSHVEIEFPQQNLNQVTKILAYSGYVQIEDMSSLNMRKDSSFDSEILNRNNEFAQLEAELLVAMSQLNIKPDKPPEQPITPITEPARIRDEFEKVRNEIQSLNTELDEAKQRLQELNQYLSVTTPFYGLGIDFSAIRNRRYLYSILGIMQTNKINRFKESLGKIPFVLLTLKQENNKTTVLLLGPRRYRDYFRYSARSAYLNTLELPDDFTGTPAKIIDRTNHEIAQTEAQIDSLTAQLSEIRSSEAAHLIKLYWQIRINRRMSDLVSHYGKMKHDYLASGWIPSRYEAQFIQEINAIGPEVLVNVLSDKELEGDLQPPINLNHKGLLRGFQSLVTIYSTPVYQEVDPTFLVMLIFPLLFGAMFGDVGQGLLFVIAGLLLKSKKIKQAQRLANIGSVVLLCGISSVFFGFMYGSSFGFEDVVQPVWQRPIENITDILIVTVAAGVVIMTLANILAIINDYRSKNYGHMLFSGKGIAGLILYWSLILILLAALIPSISVPSNLLWGVAILSLLIIMSSSILERLMTKQRPLIEGGVLTHFIQSFFELFEVLIGYFSNTLSFVRVGAFAIAHAGLSRVFLSLAEMISPVKGIGYWIVVVIGNLFILGFEGMVVGIQSMRLTYYEFFSKFFKGGGRRYHPLKIFDSSK